MFSSTSSALIAFFALSVPSLAAPVVGGTSNLLTSLHARQDTYTYTDITAAQIIAIAPGSSSCNASASFADECRTADQAAPFVNAGFRDYGVNTAGEKAALLSLMLFETGDFKFDRNHFPPPGRPGQGTRNLQMFPFNAQYARDTPSVAPQAEELLAPFAGTDLNDVPDDTKNAVLGLLLADEYLSFASAAWFYKRSGLCGEDIVEGLKRGDEAGWEAYITDCISTTVTDDRKAGYVAALEVLQ